MDFRLLPDVEEFRGQVRRILERELTPEIRNEYDHCTDYPHGFNSMISQRLGQQGLLPLTWPREVGGKEASIRERLVFDEEMAAAHCPSPECRLGPSRGTDSGGGSGRRRRLDLLRDWERRDPLEPGGQAPVPFAESAVR